MTLTLTLQLLMGFSVERVVKIKFLGTRIPWMPFEQAIQSCQKQRINTVDSQKKNNLQRQLLMTCYPYSIENVLTYIKTHCYTRCLIVHRRALKMLADVQKIIGCLMPALEGIYSSQCWRRAENTTKYMSPGHDLFGLLPAEKGPLSINL